jgi:hypothetical protein
VITTTLINATEDHGFDSVGNPLDEPTHVGLFHFDETDTKHSFGEGSAVDTYDDAIARLGRAARASASYPIAFEPSFASVGSSRDDVDMGPVANFGESHYTLDGDLVDNEPIDQILTLIADQSAAGPVRRVVAFVSPLSGADPVTKPDDRTPSPSLMDVARDTLLIPREQTIAAQLDQLRRRDTQHISLQRARRAMFEGATDPEALAASAASLATTAQLMRPVLEQSRKGSRRERRARTSVADDAAQVRQNLLTVQDLLRRALALTGDADLVTLRGLVSEALKNISNAPSAAAQAAGMQAIDAAMSPLVTLLELGPATTDGAARDQLRCELAGLEALRRHVQQLDPAKDAWSEALTDLDVLQSIATDGRTHNPQQVDLLELSATSPANLTGVQLMHFGAFYLSAWRQNDWTWGRGAGAQRLVELLVNPDWLLAANHDLPGEAAQALARAVPPASAAAVVQAATPILAQAQAARAADPDDNLVDARHALADLVLPFIRADILATEVPQLAQCIKTDVAGGSVMTTRDAQFLAAYEGIASPCASVDLVKVWTESEVGASRLPDEIVSPRFEALSTQAAAVTVNALRDTKIGAGPVHVRPLNAIAKILSPMLRFANFLATPAAMTKTGIRLIGVLTFVASLTVLAWTVQPIPQTIGLLAIGVGLVVPLVGLIFRRHAGRALSAVLLFGASSGLGIYVHHGGRPGLLALAAALGALQALVAAYSVHPYPMDPSTQALLAPKKS